MEVWKDIPGTEYSVSSEGRAASNKFGKRRVLSIRKNPDGYPAIAVYVGGARINRSVHKLVAEVFLPPKPSPKHEVNHKNGARDDNRAANLEWVTRGENQLHRFSTLKHYGARGEMAAGAILTAEKVREIRERRKAGEKLREIAADYGVGFSHISSIARGRAWAWLPQVGPKNDPDAAGRIEVQLCRWAGFVPEVTP